MASITTEPNGRRRILFVGADGERKSIRIGECSQRDAESVCRHLEALVNFRVGAQALPRETAVWANAIGDKLHDRIARTGVVQPRIGRESVRLEPAITAYLAGRKDLKPATKLVRSQVVKDLAEFFTANRDVRTITPGQADDFKQHLIGKGLAATTIHKRIQVARSFFHALRRRKLIDENPFDGVRMAASGIKDRQKFIPREDIARVLAACPNHDWKVIVALSRYGGLRCPSEVLSLRWEDINWETGRVVVTSPKTEHFADKGTRVIPLFPELRPILMDAFDAAPEGAEYVVDAKYRLAAQGPNGWLNANLRTTFFRIIRRAGLAPWPRLFHNMRASRETELVESYPVQVVTSWLGNTPAVAMKHYLMTTDAHFEAALAAPANAEKSGGGVERIPAQQVHAEPRHESQVQPEKKKNPAVCGAFPEIAFACETVQATSVAGGGFEPPTSGL
jgi:integrase